MVASQFVHVMQSLVKFHFKHGRGSVELGDSSMYVWVYELMARQARGSCRCMEIRDPGLESEVESNEHTMTRYGDIVRLRVK